MKVIDRNIMLKIELLRPHPDNPRKDVGDVTELSLNEYANQAFKDKLGRAGIEVKEANPVE